MKVEANSVEDYINKLPEDKKEAFLQLREVVKSNLPEGFEEQMSYGMLGFVVPHSIYPAGYHCKPTEALPFISLGVQKHFIGFYHMGIYADDNLLSWFKEAYSNNVKHKLDMGKSCIRLKKLNDIPYDVFAKLASKVSCKAWIETYESSIKR